MGAKFDFSGYATKNDLKCSDGRTIRRDAFKENDGKIVPLVWNHSHNDPGNVLGHALLENREDGVYCYGTFNDTVAGQNAKALVQHGDVTAMSIYANRLKQHGGDVLHGVIREVSLVLGGANPGALIDNPILAHSGEEDLEEATIYLPDEECSLVHSFEDEDEPEEPKKAIKKEDEKPKPKEGEKDMAEKTVADVFNELTEEQKKVVYFMIGQALEDAGVGYEEEEGEEMKHNIFDNDTEGNYISHADIEGIFANAKRCGSLRDAFYDFVDGDEELAHAITDDDGNEISYGIANMQYLFPEARSLNTPPDFIKRRTEWVDVVMGSVHHTPFSRIKSQFADITMEDARAKGYIKGNQKAEEVFKVLKRVTTPTTVYKKQKLDRDDVVDITDFDVVAWLKAEMRMMLDEELARAILIGDGRSAASNDKINELNIRPIWTDDDMYTIKQKMTFAASATDEVKAKEMIKQAVKARKNYKGTGSPVLFTTEDYLTSMLLLEDTIGHRLYKSIEELATAMRVSKIVTVPVMENQTRVDNGTTYNLMGIIVNLADYNVGADKGGSVNMFDDFDIDYNAQKYLIETRCSGAMIKPYSAIALEGVFQSA